MSYDYKIGSSVAALVNVKEIGVTDLPRAWDRVEPYGMTFQEFTVYRQAASGREYGDGFPACEWSFATMHPDQMDALLDYIGDGHQSKTVYIQTRLRDGTYAIYEAIMHRPRVGEDMQYVNGRWHDITLRFTCLVEQEEEEA